MQSVQSKFVLYVVFFNYYYFNIFHRTSNKGIFEQDLDVLRGFYLASCCSKYELLFQDQYIHLL